MTQDRNLTIFVGLAGAVAGGLFVSAHIMGGKALAFASVIGMAVVLLRRGPDA
jgi:hypothetical protein